MKRNRNALLLWRPTGHREVNALRTLWLVLSSPVFLIVVAVVDFAAMIHFNLTSEWWMWAIAPSAVCLAIMAFLLRWWEKGKLLVSNRQAKKFNRFSYATPWLPNRYLDQIDIESERTPKDRTTNRLLYRHLAEALVTLGLYEESEYKKVGMLTGDESLLIAPVEFYTDFVLSSGMGYIILMPPVSLISKINTVDERVISRTLREAGLVGWVVERMSYDDDLVLFLLKDETVSRAFDFSGE